MVGYRNAIRICLLQYILCLVLHIAYSYVSYEPSMTHRIAFMSTVAMILVCIITTITYRNQRLTLSIIVGSVVFSTYYIGYHLHTLAFSLLIFVASALILTMFMNKRYIIGFGISTVLLEFYFLIVHPDIILEMVPSKFLFRCYIYVYIMSLINIYFLVGSARKYFEKLEEKSQEADNANQSKSIFLASMSHEIRTPMNAICGMAELLENEDLSPKAKIYTDNIKSASNILLSLINDILDFSKIESGKFEIVDGYYRLSSLIYDVVNLIAIIINEKKVKFEVTINPETPDFLYGDEVRIRQVLINILNNAVKFTETGSICLRVDGKSEGNEVLLSFEIADTGTGIKPENLEKMFLSFERLNVDKKRRVEGTGLGLAISKQLVEMMHGTIRVESEYGVGTTFFINLKQVMVDDSQVERESFDICSKENTIAVLTEEVRMPEARVLVVDDTRVNLDVARGLLECYDIQVDCTLSGKECLEMLEDKEYDIIFMDHMMPEMDGVETLHKLREMNKEFCKQVSVIALTANAITGGRDMFLALGFSDYLSKPIEPMKLDRILRKYIPEQYIVIKTGADTEK